MIRLLFLLVLLSRLLCFFDIRIQAHASVIFLRSKRRLSRSFFDKVWRLVLSILLRLITGLGSVD